MIKRRSFLRRAATPPKREKAPKKSNPGRRKREWARAYHSIERVCFVKSLPCLVTGQTGCENAHIVGGGMGRKADYVLIVPLIPAMHAQLHSIGASQFSVLHGLDLFAAAAETHRRWLQHCGEAAA